MHYVLLVLSDPPKWNGYTFDRIIHFQEKWTIVSEINDKINKIIIIAIVIVFTGVQDSSPFFALIPASLSGQFCVLQGSTDIPRGQLLAPSLWAFWAPLTATTLPTHMKIVFP